jgi:hypothetical protein
LGAALVACSTHTSFGGTGNRHHLPRKNSLAIAAAGMKAGKFQHRVARTRVDGCKLPELGWLQRPLWIRRVLVRAQEG